MKEDVFILRQDNGGSTGASGEGVPIGERSAGRTLHDCWQRALLPHTATGDHVAWDDFDAEQQTIWNDAANLFSAAMSRACGDA